MEKKIREVIYDDFEELMVLYGRVLGYETSQVFLEKKEFLENWDRVLKDNVHHIIVAEVDGKIVSSCDLVIVPNMAYNQRPYAFIENVMTDENYRKRGLATECLEYAREIAVRENCYRIAILTSSKEEGTLDMYRRAGYNSEDKIAFLQWFL